MNPGFSAAVSSVLLAGGAIAAEPIPTLIVTGQQNHNWWFTSRVHQDTLDGTGRFACDITENPAADLADSSKVGKYRLFVLDYNGERWGEKAESNFLKAVRDGAGVVLIHAANNSFVGWSEYERISGLMWIMNTTGHGQFHAFDVEFVDHESPITKGLANLRAHPDELYHKLVNTQGVPTTLLARAMSASDKGGTGQWEPMALTLTYGSGRVFHTPLGHVWVDAQDTKASVLDPQFRTLLARGAEWAATGAVKIGTAWSDVRPQNTLSAAQKSAGWVLLFDGKTTANWRGYKQAKFPEAGWEVRDGALHRLAGDAGVDIATEKEYADFEFACEWKVAPGGNSGIMYRSTEDHTYPWETGPEMQILDDQGHADGKKPKTRAGTLYDLAACAHDVCRPAGEWNRVRIVASGTRIEHWLNDVKVVDVDTASQAFKDEFAKSKWTGVPDFNTRKAGHICLQNHGDEVWFRNMRVKDLGSK